MRLLVAVRDGNRWESQVILCVLLFFCAEYDENNLLTRIKNCERITILGLIIFLERKAFWGICVCKVGLQCPKVVYVLVL